MRSGCGPDAVERLPVRYIMASLADAARLSGLALLLAVPCSVGVARHNQEQPPMESSVSIVGEAGMSHLTGASVAQIPDAPFRQFVAAVSGHLLDKAVRWTPGRGNPGSNAGVDLTFVYRPLVQRPGAERAEAPPL